MTLFLKKSPGLPHLESLNFAVQRPRHDTLSLVAVGKVDIMHVTERGPRFQPACEFRSRLETHSVQ